MHIKKDDKVIVIAGSDKGKTGKVIRVISLAQKVLVEGINMKSHHERPKREGQKGQVVKRALPIAISNVSLIDPKSGKATRVTLKREKGKIVRISKKSKAVL
jgi:large subunit ribosomal protein L24